MFVQGISGARGGALAAGTALQEGRSRVRLPMVSLSSTQPLTEMSTSNISWGIKAIGMTKTIWWKCVQLDINKCKITNWKGR